MNIEQAKTVVLAKVGKVVQSLCLHPNELEVYVDAERIGLEHSLRVRIRTHRGDAGRVIGEKGATFNALRAAVERMSRSLDVPVTLARIMEPVIGERDSFEFKPNCRWPDGWHELLATLQVLESMLFFDSRGIVLKDARGPFKAKDDELVTHATFKVRFERGRSFKLATDALVVLADVIGRDFGRVVLASVETIPGDEEDGAQPMTAAGRNAAVK